MTRSVAATSGALWLPDAPLVLASASATRAAMLAAAGLPVESVRPDVDERTIEAAAAHLSPAELALKLAEVKARAVAGRLPGRMVLGADQVLDCDGVVLHKAKDRTAAAVKLGLLSGRSHRLTSAFALLDRDGQVHRGWADARLTMRPLSPDMIARYLDAAGDTVLTSVGAYRIEGEGLHLFERIDGDHQTILGLPMLPLLATLRTLGAIPA